MAKKQQNELATMPEQETELAVVTQDDMEGMFGPPKITEGMDLPKITILKDAALFKTGGEQFTELTGHVLFVQKHNILWRIEGKFDPADPQPPLCSSENGIKPDDDCEASQSGLCAKCPYSSRKSDVKCLNRIFVYFLIDGHIFPSAIDLAPGNYSNKAGPNKIMNFEATAKNMAYHAGIGPYFEPVRTKLTLKEVVFPNGPSACINAECIEVVKDRKFLAQLVPMIEYVKAKSGEMIKAMREEEPATEQEDVPFGNNADADDVPI